MADPAELEGMLLAVPKPTDPTPRGTPVTALPLLVPGPFDGCASARKCDFVSGCRVPAVAKAIPLVVDLRILLDADGMPRPLLGAQVDLEQLDAEGCPNGLFGAQRTGLSGRVFFRTVFPGWCPDCPPQIRLKVRYMVDAHRHASFASPLFFPDTFADAIYEWRPYHTRPAHAARNESDPVFGTVLAGGGLAGDVLTLVPRPTVSGRGYVVRRDVVLLSPARPIAYAG